MIRILLAFLLAISCSLQAYAAHPGQIIIAIRWDTYYIPTNSAERPYVQAALSNYQSRAPNCATSVDGHTINLDSCNSQAVIDGEITAAHNAGIDAWDFDFSGPTAVESNAWALYQSSSLKSQINWNLSLGYGQFVGIVNAGSASIATYTGYMAQANYQKTAGGNPILVLTYDTTSNANLAAAITTYRAAVVAAGLATPYIILFTSTSSLTGLLAATGADALGNYANTPVVPLRGSYASLNTAEQAYWATEAAAGNMVPTVVTGWDRRPIIEHPVQWQVPPQVASPGQKYMAGYNNFIAAGTPSQIAAEVTAMRSFMTAATANPSHIGVIYSWDEHIEGGSTLNPTLGNNHAILDAVAGAL